MSLSMCQPAIERLAQMNVKPGKRFLIVLALLLAAPFLVWTIAPIEAEGETIRVISSSVTSEFPEGFRFRLEVSGDNEITSVAVRLRAGQRQRGAYDYLEFEEAEVVDSELLWRTNTTARWIPPGTIITYHFEIEDSVGGLLETEPQEFVYMDLRFEWEELLEGPVAVAYHGPVRTRAGIVMDAITQTIQHLGPVLGADIETPIRVTMYNNPKEMLGALPPGSTTHRRELITEGQAFSELGTLITLGGGRQAAGTASHEVTHILVYRAATGLARRVPSWLNEGLAEYGNIAPGFTYSIALEFAIGTNRLLPITSARTLPSNSEEVIIFYGEARSIVRFMIARYGPGRMGELMATMKGGLDVDDAILEVYGIDPVTLENQWRDAIGAPLYIPPASGSAAPTPIPLPVLQPYTLTPQPSSETIASITPVPSPLALSAATPTEQQPELAADQDAPGTADEDQGGGGACSAPRPGGTRPMDATGVAILVGLVALALRRRTKS